MHYSVVVADDQPRQAEQHLYLTGVERVTRLDLICSGFQPETD